MDSDLLKYAIQEGQTFLVEHLLDQGVSPNTVLSNVDPSGNKAPALQLSLARPYGDISLALLRHGSDPTLRGSGLDLDALAFLSFRAKGSHCFQIAEEVLSRGLSIASPRYGGGLLYRRAVIEGWYDVADLLLEHGLQVNNGELRFRHNQSLLLSLIYQNDAALLSGLRYLFRLNSGLDLWNLQGSREKPYTAYHFLMGCDEYVRDDQLNSTVLRLLLDFDSTRGILEAIDGNWRTALFVAVETGNHLGVDTLLAAGASPYNCGGSVFVESLRRVLEFSHTPFASAVQELSSKYRKNRRFRDNSMRTMVHLLKHDSKLPKVSFLKAKDAILQGLSKWQSIKFMEVVLTENLPPVEQERGFAVRRIGIRWWLLDPANDSLSEPLVGPAYWLGMLSLPSLCSTRIR